MSGGKPQLNLGMHHYKISETVDEALFHPLDVPEVQYLAGMSVHLDWVQVGDVS